MSDVTRSRLARMLRGEISEEDRRALEARFLEDDELFEELAREEEALLEAWEEGALDAQTSQAVDGLVRTSTRIGTLVDLSHSVDDTADLLRPREAAPPEGPLQSVLTYRPLPWILWGLATLLALALAVVLLLQYRMVRLLDERIGGMERAAGADLAGPAPDGAQRPSWTPLLRLDAANAGRELAVRFDRVAGLTVEIRLDRTLLPGDYLLQLEESAGERVVHRLDLSLERSLFPDDPLRVVIPGAALAAGGYRLSLSEGPQSPIAAWSLQLVEE